ncbi:unnamed protein product [Toxocara canis]|uniref:RPA_interact_N domain-containing protein n=1 Tax=Toxocara canis TaxID=6265 RepID=A0A183UP22_TOXCA|nr:unnamed protein product [Toxocara canis]
MVTQVDGTLEFYTGVQGLSDKSRHSTYMEQCEHLLKVLALQMMEVDEPSEHVEGPRSAHVSLYKKRGANWREELRKKCAQHLRERREEAVSRARGLNEAVEREEINKIIREEIEAMRRSQQFEEEDLNAAIEDFEQIREELLQQGIILSIWKGGRDYLLPRTFFF